MTTSTEIIRPFLLVFRVFQWISSVIVLGLAAWAVTNLKGYRVVYTLVISVLSLVFYIPSFFTSCMHRNRGYMLPVDIIFYALWLTAFIFVAQTDLGQGNCRFFAWGVSNPCTRRKTLEAFTFLSFFWTLCGMCLEIANLYLNGRSGPDSSPAAHPEKPTAVRDGPVETSHTNPNPGQAPAPAPAATTNGEYATV